MRTKTFPPGTAALAAVGLIVAVLSGTISAIEVGEGKDLAVTLDASFVSKYIWRGYDVYDGDPAFQPSIDIGLFDTGFGVNVWGSFAFDSEWDNADELDSTLYYAQTLFAEEAHAIDLGANFIYYDFPNVSSNGNDSMEVGGSIALPNLIPLGPANLVPSYYAGYLWPKDDDVGPVVDGGWFHIFALTYDLPIPALIPSQEEQALSFTADLQYTDGPLDYESGFSHNTAGVSTSFEWSYFSLTPYLNYQWSHEDTVNEDDEFWAGISLAFSF